MEDKAQRILIIEDDRFISEMYARTLRKAGYTVEESMTGPEGLTKAKQGGWYIILLDIMLPDKTGVEIIQEIRDSGNSAIAEVKIIIMTNFEQDDATRQSMEKLADGYLIKAEITPRRMLEIIQEMDRVAPVAEPEAEVTPATESATETPAESTPASETKDSAEEKPE